MLDAFDIPALARVLSDLAVGTIGIRSVERGRVAVRCSLNSDSSWIGCMPTTPARTRALLSLDRALLDELMGGEADDSTLAMLDTMLARHRGTAPGSRARGG